jgi:predicted nuclease of predicted toxin-antitoxin system
MMRLLANENFPGDAIVALRDAGHDVLWIRTECPGATDKSVLHLAQTQDRILLRFDKDFGELAFRSRLPSQAGVVLFRITPSSPDYVSKVAVAAFKTISEWRGHFAVIEEDRIRMTPLPPDSTS